MEIKIINGVYCIDGRTAIERYFEGGWSGEGYYMPIVRKAYKAGKIVLHECELEKVPLQHKIEDSFVELKPLLEFYYSKGRRKYDMSKIRYTMVEDGCNLPPTVLLKMNKDKKETEQCPFCKSTHIHGIGLCGRVAHCNSMAIPYTLAPDGTLIENRRYYILD